MSTLGLRNVTYTYQTQYQKVDALKGISHCFDAGLLHAWWAAPAAARPRCCP